MSEDTSVKIGYPQVTGTCQICGQVIPVGDRAMLNAETGLPAFHEACHETTLAGFEERQKERELAAFKRSLLSDLNKRENARLEEMLGCGGIEFSLEGAELEGAYTAEELEAIAQALKRLTNDYHEAVERFKERA
jgi:hypothetical protein